MDATTYDELYSIAQDLDVRGRGDMTKAELHEAISQEVDEWQEEVTEVEQGDKVQMNHLASTLTVYQAHSLEDQEIVVLRTNRGGFHKLVVTEEGAHLERWRNDTREWMNNSADPTHFEIVSN